jgi:hypothetical protein
MKCLVLLASMGDRPEWGSRMSSTGHRAIPLPSGELVRKFPMISNLVKQFVPTVQGNCEFIEGETPAQVADNLIAKLRQESLLQ